MTDTPPSVYQVPTQDLLKKCGDEYGELATSNMILTLELAGTRSICIEQGTIISALQDKIIALTQDNQTLQEQVRKNLEKDGVAVKHPVTRRTTTKGK